MLGVLTSPEGICQHQREPEGREPKPPVGGVMGWGTNSPTLVGGCVSFPWFTGEEIEAHSLLVGHYQIFF